MLTSVPEAGIWLSTAPADMRKSFDGLAGLVRNRLGADPASGGWYIFINRRRTMMKILGFGPGGCWIWSQRPRAGPLRASRRASGGVHRALADRSPGAAGRRRLRRDPPPQALRAAAGRRARKKLEYFLIFLRFGAFGA